MAPPLSPEQQIAELRQALAERDAVIAAHSAEAVIVQARLTTALLEIEHIKVQLASLRRQRYGQSSEKLDSDIAQLEMRLEDFEETFGEQAAANPKQPESAEGRCPITLQIVGTQTPPGPLAPRDCAAPPADCLQLRRL